MLRTVFGDCVGLNKQRHCELAVKFKMQKHINTYHEEDLRFLPWPYYRTIVVWVSCCYYRPNLAVLKVNVVERADGVEGCRMRWR